MFTYSTRDKISSEFAQDIKRILSCEKIILFGSTARKDDRISSDIDICIVGGVGSIEWDVRKLINDLVTDYLIEKEVLINWLYFTLKQWRTAKDPIINTIKREGRVLWEKEKIE